MARVKIPKTPLLFLLVFTLVFILFMKNFKANWQSTFFTKSLIFFESPAYVYSNVTAPSVLFTLPLRGSGIGNQLFLYACSYSVARSNKIPLYLHCPHQYCQNGNIPNDRSFTASKREFVLDKFNISMVNFIDETVVNKLIKKNITYFNDQDILEKSYTVGADKVLKHDKGYFCQSQEYWWEYKDEIRSMFKINPDSIRWDELATIREKIANSESVAVHVRRGDFITTGGPHPPISMQRRAIRKMENILRNAKANYNNKTQITYFIFSDDYAYAKEKLLDLHNDFDLQFIIDIISDTTSLEDLLLMTECKHIIFQDSTFSWWAAWLNENPQKVVITSAFHPDFWRTNRVRNGSQFYWKLYGMMYHPKEWIVLNPFTGGI